MSESLYRQYLAQARRLAKLDPMRPRQGNLRRAVSTTYYGLFHYLVDQACRTFLGTSNDHRAYRNILARAFQHETMAAACKPFSGGQLPKNMAQRLPNTFAVPPELRGIASTFQEAQEKRNLADYDLSKSFTRSDCLAFIRDVDEAVTLFRSIANRPEARFFLSCLLAWKTLEGRR